MATKLPRRSTALVVSEDSGLRENLAQWLEDDGIEVTVCAGPRAPHFSCVGLRGEPCPLVGGADLILVDLHPEPGELVDHTSRTELLRHYLSPDRRVVAMVEGSGTVDLPQLDGVALCERLAGRGVVLEMVHQLLGESSSP